MVSEQNDVKITFLSVFYSRIFFKVWKKCTKFIASLTRKHSKSIYYWLSIFYMCRRNVCHRNVRSVVSAKCLSAKYPIGEMSVGKMFGQRNVCWQNVCRRKVLVPLSNPYIWRSFSPQAQAASPPTLVSLAAKKNFFEFFQKARNFWMQEHI